ncbi:MAG: hypothetical protein ACTSQQ_12385, partial [Candidatus Helarchaeota archaeon]
MQTGADKKVLDGSYTYTLGTTAAPNPTQTITLSELEDLGRESWVTFTVKTVGLKRVNTLAIYSEENFYDGHYPELERFTMIILDVDGADGPFVD